MFGSQQWDIVSSRADGGDLQVVKAFGTRQVSHAVWSPDGRQIAFTDITQGVPSSSDGYPVYVMDADGNNERQMCSAGWGSFAWSPDSRTLAYCPLGMAQATMLGQTYNAWRGEVEMADVATGSLVYRRGVLPNQPIVSGPPSVSSWYHVVPRWNGLGHLIAQRVVDTTTATRTNPGVEPAQYSYLRVLESQLKEYGFTLPSVGDLLPATNLANPDNALLLDMSTTAGAGVTAQMNFERFRSDQGNENRLVVRYGDGSAYILARDPVVSFPPRSGQNALAQFSWTPDGTQCAWDFQLYDWADFLRNGPAGARSLGYLPNRGDDFSWFLTPA